ncbi:MAG: hypothetical protein QGH45_04240 [Myxococcota bacterium]|jgi:hypothetical protein|nr:hypothetical protein [Myxococcota bacterium]
MRYVLYAFFALLAFLVLLAVLDLVNQGIAEKRIKEARFYLESPNPDEASKLAARAMRKVQDFPTLHGARRDRTLEAGAAVLLEGLAGVFAEQYARDLRFNPGPQWEICEARASIADEALCVDAAAQAAAIVAHNAYLNGSGEDGVAMLRACVEYEKRPEVSAICVDQAGTWLGEEAATLMENGKAIAAAEAVHACVATRDMWEPSQQCIDDWHVTVRRARNALVPKHNACAAVLLYNDMPPELSESVRVEAETERAELRASTALIRTIFHYDVMEFAPATRYWGRGEESTKYHLGQMLKPAGYTLQWHEEEHPEGAWDTCEPAYQGAIEVHEVRGKYIQAFKKEVLTVRVQGQLRIVETATNRPWLEASVEGGIPKDWFKDEESFLQQAEMSREKSWQDAHEKMKEWEITSLTE